MSDETTGFLLWAGLSGAFTFSCCPRNGRFLLLLPIPKHGNDPHFPLGCLTPGAVRPCLAGRSGLDFLSPQLPPPPIHCQIEIFFFSFSLARQGPVGRKTLFNLNLSFPFVPSFRIDVNPQRY